jgi:hypothetical protein
MTTPDTKIIAAALPPDPSGRLVLVVGRPSAHRAAGLGCTGRRSVTDPAYMAETPLSPTRTRYPVFAGTAAISFTWDPTTLDFSYPPACRPGDDALDPDLDYAAKETRLQIPCYSEWVQASVSRMLRPPPPPM